MIHRGSDGFPVDQYGDGGDSAMRAGILNLFTDRNEYLYYYECKGNLGWLKRHPNQHIWDMPLNFSRDQLICLMAGIRYFNELATAKRVFWKHARRLFFCQNICRDIYGSWKKPWPHWIRKDGERVLEKPQFRWFDFADPLAPHHIWHLIICAQIKWLYWFAPIGWLFLIGAIIFNSKELDAEQNQLQCMVKRAGPFFVKAYKFFNPRWQDQTIYYWETRRNQKEFGQAIINNL